MNFSKVHIMQKERDPLNLGSLPLVEPPELWPLASGVHQIAHPAAIVLAEFLGQLAKTFAIRRTVVQVFEPASQYGREGIDELQKQHQEMAQRIRSLGGSVSERARGDGSTSPYELNINYLDALADPAAAEGSAVGAPTWCNTGRTTA